MGGVGGWCRSAVLPAALPSSSLSLSAQLLRWERPPPSPPFRGTRGAAAAGCNSGAATPQRPQPRRHHPRTAEDGQGRTKDTHSAATLQICKRKGGNARTRAHRDSISSCCRKGGGGNAAWSINMHETFRKNSGGESGHFAPPPQHARTPRPKWITRPGAFHAMTFRVRQGPALNHEHAQQKSNQRECTSSGLPRRQAFLSGVFLPLQDRWAVHWPVDERPGTRRRLALLVAVLGPRC